MKQQEPFWTIPNILSLYRMVVFPFILYLAITGAERLFAIFIAINLVTDWLDGQIARAFNMQTKLGAKLDSYADVGTYILVFLGVFLFKWSDIQANYLYLPLCLFLGFYLIDKFFALLKYGRVPSYHNYLFKTTGYVQGIFFFCWFIFDFYEWFYLLATGIGVLACIEEIILTYLLPKPASDVKGLFWVLKRRTTL